MMITLYQCTIFASLALMAIVVAIFIFATSIYRGASILSTKEEEDSLSSRKELIEIKKKELTEKLQSIDNKSFAKQLREESNELDAELEKIDQSILKSRNKVEALTVKKAVGIPGSLLIMSIVGSGVAIAVSGVLGLIPWVLSLALLVASLYFIYRNLCTVEFFSGVIDLSTLMEQALERHTLKMTPLVDMEVWDFLLEIEQGETQEVKYHTFLKKGRIGRNTRVKFVATEELDFPEEEVRPMDIGDYKSMKKAKEFWHQLGDINPKSYLLRKFKVKAPEQPGEYFMSYWIQCDEYTGDETPFRIKVTEKKSKALTQNQIRWRPEERLKKTEN